MNTLTHKNRLGSVCARGSDVERPPWNREVLVSIPSQVILEMQPLMDTSFLLVLVSEGSLT